MKKNTKKSGNKILKIGAGLAMAGAGYYLLGPEAKKHQRKTLVLAGKVKDELQKDAGKIKKDFENIMDSFNGKKTTKSKVSKKRKS